jgi:hypothetical protein
VKPIEPRPPQIWSGQGQQIPAGSKSEAVSGTECSTDCPELDVDLAEENILKITDVIGGTLTRLFRVYTVVRNTIQASQTHKTERFKVNEEAGEAIGKLRLHTESYIDSKFPKTPKMLRSALIGANALRFRRLCYQRSHHKRTDVDIERLTKKSNTAVSDDTKTVKSMSAVKLALGVLPKPATTRDLSALSPLSAVNLIPAQDIPAAAFHADPMLNASEVELKTQNSKPRELYISLMQQCPVCGVVLDTKNSADITIWQ